METKQVVALQFAGTKIEVRSSDSREGQMREVEKALKVFKRKMEKDDIIKQLRDRKYYTKPSEKRRAEEKKRKKVK
jgi:ribosomal protein S21